MKLVNLLHSDSGPAFLLQGIGGRVRTSSTMAVHSTLMRPKTREKLKGRLFFDPDQVRW